MVDLSPRKRHTIAACELLHMARVYYVVFLWLFQKCGTRAAFLAKVDLRLDILIESKRHFLIKLSLACASDIHLRPQDRRQI